MDFSQTIVRLDRINERDQRYRISCNTDIERLTRSIAECGLINPPILIEHDGRLIVISGFGRIAAVRCLEWTEMAARILAPDTPPGTCIQIAVTDNSSQRQLNICEQIRAIALISGHVQDQEDLLRRAQACGLAVNRKVISDLLKVAELPPALISGLLSGAIALPIALRLIDFKDRQEAEMLGMLLMELDLSLNRQRETIDWIEAIARREGLAIQQLLESPDLSELRLNRQIDRRQKAVFIRNYLKSRRFPALNEAEQRFDALRSSLKLPATVQLIAPPGFESRSYTIQLQVTRPEEIADLQLELKRLMASPKFQSLFS